MKRVWLLPFLFSLTGCGTVTPADIYRSVLVSKAQLVDNMWFAVDEESASKRIEPILTEYQENMQKHEAQLTDWNRKDEWTSYLKTVRKPGGGESARGPTSKEAEVRKYAKDRKQYLVEMMLLEGRFLREKERLHRLADLYVVKYLDEQIAAGNKNPAVSYKLACPKLAKLLDKLANVPQPRFDVGEVDPTVYKNLGMENEYLDPKEYRDKYPIPPLKSVNVPDSIKLTLHSPPPLGVDLVYFAAFQGVLPKTIDEISFEPIFTDGNPKTVGLIDPRDMDGICVTSGSVVESRASAVANKVQVGTRGRAMALYPKKETLKHVRWVGSASSLMYFSPIPPSEKSPQGRRDLDYFVGYRLEKTRFYDGFKGDN